jgi:aminotransferase
MDRRSARIGHLEQSEIRAMSRECARVGGINLGQGICDLPTPEEVLEGASRAVLDDMSVYSPYEGVDPLRAQIAAKARAHNGLTPDPDDEIVVTIGATGALACTAQSLFDPGDEFILFEPYYGYHLNTIRVAGQSARFVTLEPPDWRLTREMLEAARTEATRGIIFSTPCNPSGKVFDRAELEIVAAFCREHDLIAITDEIYEYIVYDDREHLSLATLPGMWERTVTISGFSKTFSITGWRLGYVVAHRDLAGPIGLVNDLFYVCAPTPLQHGVAEGMARLDESYYEQMRRDYQDKRDFFCEALDGVGLTPYVPDGAYYVLADVRPLGCADDKAAAMHLLEEGGVASVPGRAFYASQAGASLTRFCFAKEWDVLREAAARLEALS